MYCFLCSWIGWSFYILLLRLEIEFSRNGKELLQARTWSWWVPDSQYFISWRVVFVALYSYQVYAQEKNLIEWIYELIWLALFSEKRRAEAARIREKYPDRIPVRIWIQNWIIHFQLLSKMWLLGTECVMF